MNPTKRSKLEDLATIGRMRAEHERLSTDAQVDEKLAWLRTFIDQLAQTTHGQADLKRRAQEFGPCVQAADESNRRYYGRLRRWLDADLLSPAAVRQR